MRRAAVGCAVIALAVCACRRDEEAKPHAHTLRLPAENVTMPDGPSRDVVTSACVPCHSPRYVLDQPRLPRKTWQAEVDKMKNVYGAPIAPEDVPRVVDYLVAVDGDGT